MQGSSGLGHLQRSTTDPFGRAGTAAVTMACVSQVTVLYTLADLPCLASRRDVPQ
jgi:hypothetical protein